MTDTIQELSAEQEPASGAGVADMSPPSPSSPAPTSTSPAHPPPAARPTQEGPQGLRFDFNQGCRVTVPPGTWRVLIRDLDTGNILFESHKGGTCVLSTKRYYVRFGVEAWRDGERVFVHETNLTDREVLIQFPVGTLGDLIGWFPYAVKFQEKHGCRLTCAMGPALIEIFKDAYPDIAFVLHEDIVPEAYYATYSIGLFFDDHENIWQPVDFRHVGLHRTAGYILGVDPAEKPPRIALPPGLRPITGRYVCIAVQSSSGAKYWNNPHGWRDVIRFLKSMGYRVVCIDKTAVHGADLVWHHIPHGAEDETGDRPLLERARWLKHADLFIGLSSGLSWLAWAMGTPVVMISGFTTADNEFKAAGRVINYHTCNGCWNDVRVRFDHANFFWCPRHANTPRQFECTRLITGDHVIDVIKTVIGQHGSPRAQNESQ
jgi:autotransporter strand-loop-strand O-heptosyltransferase